MTIVTVQPTDNSRNNETKPLARENQPIRCHQRFGYMLGAIGCTTCVVPVYASLHIASCLSWATQDRFEFIAQTHTIIKENRKNTVCRGQWDILNPLGAAKEWCNKGQLSYPKPGLMP